MNTMQNEEHKNEAIVRIDTLLFASAFMLSISTNYIDASIYNNAILVLMVISVSLHLLEKQRLRVRKNIFYLTVAVIGIIIYNFFISPLATQKLLIHLSCFLIGYSICDYNIFEQRQFALNTILKTYMYILLVTAAIGVLESFVGNIFDPYAVRVYAATYRLHSVFLHPIIFSLMMLQLFVLSHYYIDNRIVKSIVGFAAFYCIFMTLTRAAWLTFAIVIILLAVHRVFALKEPIFRGKVFNKRRIIETGIVIVLLVILISESDLGRYISTFWNRWNALEGSTSINYRSSTITAILDGIKRRSIIQWIFGAGNLSAQSLLGNYGIYFGRVGNNVVDNQWLAVFADFGLLGLFGLIYLLIYSFKSYFNKALGINIWALALCTISILLVALVCDVFYWATAGCISFIMFGLLYANIQTSNRGSVL